MDGNGRWAAKKGLPKIAGHRAGVNGVREAIKSAKSLGVKVLTLYTFSTENWNRPEHEVNMLFKLLEDYMDKKADELDKNDIRLSVIGRMDGLPVRLQERLKKVIERTKTNSSLILNLALNYGGRAEIVDAAKKIIKDCISGKIKIEEIDEKSFSRCLYTKDLPDPDLLIRTSGEMRVSNFLLWQIAYSEIYVTKKLWPDFKESDFKKAVSEYQKRERRYGG
ncbi:MAG: isoprenyl transferase [Candidatus Omnitrophica bacterium]|nr:isoprenyl transferase [Candidatus Omnitrophota bacterium]